MCWTSSSHFPRLIFFRIIIIPPAGRKCPGWACRCAERSSPSGCSRISQAGPAWLGIIHIWHPYMTSGKNQMGVVTARGPLHLITLNYTLLFMENYKSNRPSWVKLEVIYEWSYMNGHIWKELVMDLSLAIPLSTSTAKLAISNGGL